MSKRTRAQKPSKAALPARKSTSGVSGVVDLQSSSVTGWSEEGGLIYCDFGSAPAAKILGFDMDSTLIKTRSGKTFATDEHDWELLYDVIPQVIQKYVSDGYRVVIFTNQQGISTGQVGKTTIQRKIGVPVLAMAATEDDEFRKPRTGMWDYLCSHLSQGQSIDVQSSIYVGDAAGRPAKAQRKKDFNDNDLKYALNIGCEFKTPEQFFLGESDSLPKIVFNPKDLPTNGVIFKGKSGNENIKRSHQEMVIFVGSPGSGKSTFWKNFLEDYIRINNDTLKSKDRCLKAAENALSTGKSCVIDNTNPTPEARSAYIQLAQKYTMPVRAFVFAIPKDLAFHLDTLRKVNKHRNHLSKKVGSMPIHKFYKDFVRPSVSEGLQEVEEIEFIAGPFESEEERKVFFSYVHA